jgi:hypothetical protein
MDYNCWSHREKVGLGWCESEGKDEARSAKSLSGVNASCWVLANALRNQSELLNLDWGYDQLVSMIRRSPGFGMLRFGFNCIICILSSMIQ